jgi:hypothetical protein
MVAAWERLWKTAWQVGLISTNHDHVMLQLEIYSSSSSSRLGCLSPHAHVDSHDFNLPMNSVADDSASLGTCIIIMNFACIHMRDISIM